ncbi:ATPase AAA [Pseudoalteromonas luteoviolacea CPMOR-2]|uniref:AAA family ATPase n=1 Tax=Pseudoalteromonas luteoviolacea TaxID=43657 RepID=UPI0007B081D8|nr:MoxR family ATPase [Pseudoalteromonas luteoviolacea]KZN51853.1 ATPase AAA [Pseudoalteromonas luteoviolacea CPMOR-2]
MNQTSQNIISKLSELILGKDEQLKLALCCLLSKGHLLIEDLPGMGKTTLSHGLANVLGLSYQRVQFTSDLLPADITGSSIFNTQTHSFDFHSGPIFSQVLLADEINRASPKTQSALLEAMEEGQVTVDGTTHTLPEPFFVIATQNPLHQSGTHPLPESQLDRFFIRISLGYPDTEAEKSLIMSGNDRAFKLEDLSLALSSEELSELQKQVMSIKLSEPVVQYIIDLVSFTRDSGEFGDPLSPRASIALGLAARAYALISGRDFVLPDDIQAVFGPVAGHRLNVPCIEQISVVESIFNRVPVPM